jgi:hypothetical protein
MKVRCPACEAVFRQSERDPKCPHDLRQPDQWVGFPTPGPITSDSGWCEQHQVWGCMFQHGFNDFC